MTTENQGGSRPLRGWTLQACAVLALGVLMVLPAFAADRQGAAAVSSPERLSTVAGLKILRAGGSAADAAVAVAFSLGVLRPLESGIGSGGVALYYDQESGEVWALDFRSAVPNPAYAEESAPAEPLPMAVPGLTAGMAELHRKFGDLSWKAVLETPVALARQGAGPGNGPSISDEVPVLPSWASEGGAAESLALMLERIGARGPTEFYEGEISRRLVAQSKVAGGIVTPRALSEYEARWRSPVRIDFRGDRVYTLPSPAGAGSAFVEMVNVLAGFEWDHVDSGSPSTIHLFVEAERYGRRSAEAVTSERGSLYRPGSTDSRRTQEVRRKLEEGSLDMVASEEGASQQTLSFVVADAAGNLAVVALSLGPLGGSAVLVDDAFYVARTQAPADTFASLPVLVVSEGGERLGVGTTGSAAEAMIGASVYLRHALLGAGLEELVDAPRYLPARDVHTIVCEKIADLRTIDGLNILGHGVDWQGRLGIVHLIAASDSGVGTVSDPRGGTTGGY